MLFSGHSKFLNKSKTKGFTIVELLIVIVIIGILAAIVIVAYNGITSKARDAERVAELTSIQKALGLYAADNGNYPSCVNTVQICLASALVPKYMGVLPADPVNSGSNVYRYANGYKKLGPTSYSNSGFNTDYILGTKGDVNSTAYSGWGFSDLTILIGN